jgi:hypothetical protein
MACWHNGDLNAVSSKQVFLDTAPGNLDPETPRGKSGLQLMRSPVACAKIKNGHSRTQIWLRSHSCDAEDIGSLGRLSSSTKAHASSDKEGA